MRSQRLKNFLILLRDMSGAWPLLVIFALTMAVVLWLQPVKAGLALWSVSKICLAAWVGNVVDRVSFRPEARPHLQGGSLEHCAAWLRRALIVAAAVVAGGLIP